MALLTPRKRVPFCETCDREHYNFQPCQGVPQTPIVRFTRPRDGYVDVADKTTSVVVAEGVYGRPRKPLHSEMAA